MRYEPLRSFDRSLRRLPQVDKERTKKAIIKLKDFFEGEAQPSGLGLKKLYEDIWEIRVDMRLRVIFRLQSDLVQWGLLAITIKFDNSFGIKRDKNKIRTDTY